MKTDRRRLDSARANGYLDATGAAQAALIRAHGFWCWRLRVPLIWFARANSRSKHGSVHLDLFTTANVLSDQGQSELAALCDRLLIPEATFKQSRFDAMWENVPRARMEELAATVLRVVTRLGHYNIRPATHSPELAKMIEAITNPAPIRKSA